MVKNDRQAFFFHKLTNISFVFLAFVFSFRFANGQGEKDPNFKDLKTVAVAVVERGNVFSDPALTSKKIGKFKFNDCFMVTGAIIQPVKGKAGLWEWARVQTTDESLTGWIQAESIRWVYQNQWKPTPKIDWNLVRYRIASDLYKDLEISEKILNQLLKKNPKFEVPIEDEEDGATVNRPLSEVVPERVAQLNTVAGRYDIAIKKYAQLIERSRSNPEKKARYCLKMVNVLAKDDKADPKLKERWYWRIIKEEPSIEVSGDEWNAWVDENAALALLLMKRSSNNEEELGITGDKLMKVAKNFRVYILGAEAKIESLMAKKQCSTAKKLLLKAYNKYPSGVSVYFKSEINSTLLLFGAYLKGFDQVDPSRAQKLAAIQELEDMKLEAPVKNYIAYQKLVTLDDGPGLIDDLSQAGFNGFDYDIAYFLSRNKYYDAARFEKIKLSSNFQTYQAILNDDSSLSLSHDLQDKSLNLTKGMQVTVEYTDSTNELVKIKLADGKVGWLGATSLKILKPEPLFPVLANANYWKMVGGNPGRSYYNPEKPIRNPVLLQKLPYFHSDEPLIVDLDGDQRPEIITNDLNRNLNVIRGDGDGILFKLKDLVAHGVPSFMGDTLFIIGDRGKEGKWMEAVGKDGTKKWDVKIGKDRNDSWPEGSYVFEDKLYSQRLINGRDSAFQCFDLKTGKEIWAYSYNHSSDFRPLFQENIGIFIAEHHFMEKDEIIVIDLKSQKILWEMEKPRSASLPSSAESLLVSNGIIVFHDFGFIQANRLMDGKLLWAEKNVEALGNQPNINLACDGKSVFVFDALSNNVSLKCVDLATGKRIWTTKEDSNYSHWPVGRMAVINGALYYSRGTSLVALDTQTGNELWELSLPGGEGFGGLNSRNSSVVPAAGHIVVSAGNTIFIIGETSK